MDLLIMQFYLDSRCLIPLNQNILVSIPKHNMIHSFAFHIRRYLQISYNKTN
jgi:hypothetical protein